MFLARVDLVAWESRPHLSALCHFIIPCSIRWPELLPLAGGGTYRGQRGVLAFLLDPFSINRGTLDLGWRGWLILTRLQAGLLPCRARVLKEGLLARDVAVPGSVRRVVSARHHRVAQQLVRQP